MNILATLMGVLLLTQMTSLTIAEKNIEFEGKIILDVENE